MLTRTGHTMTRTIQGPGQGLDLQGQVKDKNLTHKDQDKDLNLVLKDKDFAYSYLLQVAAKPTIAIKQHCNNEHKVKIHNIWL